jgi:predicted nicotinamide N-methyase
VSHLASADAEALICEYTLVRQVALVPEIRLYLADELVPLWQASEWRAAAPQPPPFWAFAWPGSQALARFVLDDPSSVAGQIIMDFGAGSGLAAIAAMRAGAARVVACDIEPLAAVVQARNAALNRVSFERFSGDATAWTDQVDVVLAGDVCYEREASERTIAWLRERAAVGARVFVADPGRHYAPTDGLELLATYDVPTLHELESSDFKRTRIWRLRGD